MDWANFWSNFWPDFCATISGVLIGVPIALWIERRRGADVEKARIHERAARLRVALSMVDGSLQSNLEAIEFLDSLLAEDRFPYDLRLDLGTWESVRGEVNELLRDAKLQAHLARYFERLKVLTALHGRLLDSKIGGAATIGNAARTSHKLIEDLQRIAKEIRASTATLRKDLPRLEL